MKRIASVVIAALAFASAAVSEVIIDVPAPVITKTIERTWRANIETPFGQSQAVTVYRERLQLAADGSIVVRTVSLSPVARSSDEISGKIYTVTGGVQITGAQLFEAMTIAFDQAATEDNADGNSHGLGSDLAKPQAQPPLPLPQLK